ncbi:MATE family efflux transporter [Ruminococcaceae bacterium OttesenSCG-928-L11]|nr:MATE family efflux transporter [Ruminococcaceae bacterium OttesenSCG-928-L11]
MSQNNPDTPTPKEETLEKKPKGRSSIDMTEGAPAKKLLLFCIPLLLGNIMQQLYNTVDSMVVGRFVSSNALAAVGASGPIIHLMVAFFMGLSAGASILISQSFGAKEYKKLEDTIHTILSLTLIVSVVIAAVGAAISPLILRLLNTPEEVFPMANTYMIITFIGIISLMLYNLINAVLHGTGDARSPFIILVICCIINIILDLVFVLAFDWGVAGVAWATVIAQTCSVVFGLWRINTGDKVFRIHLKKLRPTKSIVLSILRLGVPSGAQNALSSVGNILVQSVINSFGPVIMAANVAVIKVDSFCTMPIMTFGTAVTVFVGQNAGAGKNDRIKDGVRSALMMSVGISLVISIVLFLWGNYPLALFTQEQAVIQAGMDKFHRVAPFYFCMAVFGVFSGAIRGQGYAIAPMLIGVGTMFVGRVPVAFLLSRAIGANGIHWSLSVQWALEAVIIVLYYHFGGWQKKAAQLKEKREREAAAQAAASGKSA